MFKLHEYVVPELKSVYFVDSDIYNFIYFKFISYIYIILVSPCHTHTQVTHT